MPGDDDYTVHSALPAESVSVRFAGPFQGRQTTWDMQLQTLAYWQRHQERTNGPGTPSRGVIEVGREHGGVRELVVALNVARIDLPTLRKTVVMIRNYRRLRPGRHAWGDDPGKEPT